MFKNHVKQEVCNLIYDIKIPLEPLSVRLPEKCKLRISIGGADASNFKKFPEEEHIHPIWNIYHNSEYFSSIKVPIIPGEQSSPEE